MPTLIQKQLFSAINIGSPWRGLNVMPSAPTTANELAAAMFLFAIFPEDNGTGVFGASLGHLQARDPNFRRREPHFEAREENFRRREPHFTAREPAFRRRS